MLKLIPVKFTSIQEYMDRHYSAPKRFVGRSITYQIEYNGIIYGGIAGGSAIMHLKGRDEFFGIQREWKKEAIQRYINNIFYHVERVGGCYPSRNFAVRVLKEFRNKVVDDWRLKYKDDPLGFETLIELPRTGETYKRDGWVEVGQTIGYTCKREGDPDGIGTDSWSGRRVWNTQLLRPKRVFCREL